MHSAASGQSVAMCRASAHFTQGKYEKARAAADEVLRINPNFSVSQIRIRYRDPDKQRRFLSALRKAGLPE